MNPWLYDNPDDYYENLRNRLGLPRMVEIEHDEFDDSDYETPPPLAAPRPLATPPATRPNTG